MKPQQLLIPLLILPGSSPAQTPPDCAEDLVMAGRILYTYWSFVVFYPNSTNLQALFEEFLPEARAAPIPDACADVLERFLARVNDGHANLEYYPGRTIRTRPPVSFRSIRDGYTLRAGAAQPVRVFVVARDTSESALRDLPPGSEVLKVNGLAVDSVYGRWHARISGSTPWWRDHVADKVLLLGPAESEVTMTVRTPGGQLRQITLPRPPDPYGYDEKLREKALKEAEDTVTVAEGRVLDGSWGYMRVQSFLGKDPGRTARRIAAVLDPLLDRPGLILDLRDNHGGFVEAALELAGRFVDERTVVAHMQMRQPGSKEYVVGFWDPKRGVHAAPPVHAKPRKPIYEGPLVVLVDAGCFSACELLAGGLQSIGRATVVGTGRTGGGSGTVAGHKLPSGAVITFSLFVSWRPEGRRKVEFVGIEPDVQVSERVSDWVEGRDRVLETAIELLEQGKARTLADFEAIEG